MEPPQIFANIFLAIQLGVIVRASPLDSINLPLLPVRKSHGGDRMSVEAVNALYCVFGDHGVRDVAASQVGRDDGVGVGGDLEFRSRGASDIEGVCVWQFLFHPSSGGAAVVTKVLAPPCINFKGQTPVVCVLLPQVPTLRAVPFVLADA